MDKLAQLREIKESFNLASKKEVASIVAELIKAIKDLGAKHKEMESGMKSDMEEQMKVCTDMCAKLEGALGESEAHLRDLVTKGLKRTSDEAYKALNREIYKIEELIRNIPQFDSTQLESKFGAVISDLESKINSYHTLTAYEIRDSLESIQDENEKLDWTAVRGVTPIHVGKKPPEDTGMVWIEPLN